MPHWDRSSSRGSRGLATAVSMGLTLALLRLFGPASPGPTPQGRPPAMTVVPVRLAAIRPAADAPRSSAPRPADRPVRRPVTTHRASSITPPPASLPAEPAPTAAAAPATASVAPPMAEPAPASSPLRLDAQTLGRAVAGAEGSVRRMARHSGTAVDLPRPTQSESWSSAVARTAVPDCLAPNGGGSLLSLPVMAYQAMKGRCK